MAPKKAKTAVYEQVGDTRKILSEIDGTKFCAVTSDTLYMAGLAGSWGQVKVTSYPLDAISTINIKETSGIFGGIRIEVISAGHQPIRPDAFSVLFGGGGSPNLDNLAGFEKRQREEVRGFVNLALDLRNRREDSSTQQAATPIPDQIKQLAELRDMGILSEEEFQAKKNDLLSRM